MKNDDQMFQSVLSRRDEYRERRKKRILTIKHTVPVLACFCLCAVLGLGYRNHFGNKPSIPVQPDGIDEPTLEAHEITTSTESETTTQTQIDNQTEPVFTTAPTSESETDSITTVSATIRTTNKTSSDTITATSTTTSISKTETESTSKTTTTQNHNELSYSLEKINCSLPDPPSQVPIDPVTGQEIPFVAQIEYDGERWNVVLAESCEDACIVSGVITDHVLCLSVACLSAQGEYSEETTGFSLRFSNEVNASICDIHVERQDFESASEFYEVYTDTPLILNDS